MPPFLVSTPPRASTAMAPLGAPSRGSWSPRCSARRHPNSPSNELRRIASRRSRYHKRSPSQPTMTGGREYPMLYCAYPKNGAEIRTYTTTPRECMLQQLETTLEDLRDRVDVARERLRPRRQS